MAKGTDAQKQNKKEGCKEGVHAFEAVRGAAFPTNMQRLGNDKVQLPIPTNGGGYWEGGYTHIVIFCRLCGKIVKDCFL